MIVKYRMNDVWGYIDNIRQCATKLLSPNELILEYDNEVGAKERDDVASYIDFGNEKLEPVTADVAMWNKVFLKATENLEESGKTRRCTSILDISMSSDHPAYIITLYLEEYKEFDELVLVANDAVYLMNDKGQTIERLV